MGRDTQKNYNEPSTTKWVGQEHTFGCVLASLAMVIGDSYSHVHDLLSPKIWKSVKNDRDKYEWERGNDFDKAGWYIDDAYRWLEEHGYATQMRYRLRWGHVRRHPWPPKPFAPVHMASVITLTGTVHAVVYTAEGIILDPAREPGTWEENWRAYKEVKHVCGIWKVGK